MELFDIKLELEKGTTMGFTEGQKTRNLRITSGLLEFKRGSNYRGSLKRI